jgi:hypothetical protein
VDRTEHSAHFFDQSLDNGLVQGAFDSSSNNESSVAHFLVAHLEHELLRIGGPSLR